MLLFTSLLCEKNSSLQFLILALLSSLGVRVMCFALSVLYDLLSFGVAPQVII